MPTYVYSCTDHPQQKKEVIHSMGEDPLVTCPDCQKPMHRVPQAFRYYLNPQLLLMDKLTKRFEDYRKEKKYGIQRNPNPPPL